LAVVNVVVNQDY